MGREDITGEAFGFLKDNNVHNQVKDALNSQQTVDISDKLLGGVAGVTGKITGGTFAGHWSALAVIESLQDVGEQVVDVFEPDGKTYDTRTGPGRGLHRSVGQRRGMLHQRVDAPE